ncbi:ABC transporter substrate-binding protein [Sporolactobacillus terrae]|uniref:Solute-binding protein family 5 domain-containing protein n=1 Tax=Sporolactobacillus terrae TaxID=269673 RepID=A0ABX5Q4R9_9BACL|nr:ABC transporter substrate-binding protein [Sporolactobacillus terrae]QAA21640.1 hypothetical protein C0674_02840 [Sporolactobacillus terrae]QAA24612.1 hypothetical protein C0679_02820 [Sporolactobacillus terrae]UAK16449.1 hypothetical protein K7399_00215 [Sporolactobacillus terrae]
MNHLRMNRFICLIIGLTLVFTLVGCGSQASDQTDSAPTKGGTLKVAYASEPDTLDWSFTSATATRDIGWNIFETLFALDKNYTIKPLLATGYKVSSDKKTYTITLRKHVPFQDGSVMSADDVIASLDRWRKVSSVGQITNSYIKKVSKLNDQTLRVDLKTPYSSFIESMSAPKSALAIIPEKIAKQALDQPLNTKQLIGTGPYQFAKWDKGQKIELKRFKKYASRKETNWGGLTGKKTAYFDKIDYLIVKDTTVRQNGLKTGLYDYAQGIPSDLYDTLKNSKQVAPVTYINGYSTLTPDKSEPPFNDLKARQALNAALNKKAIAQATYGNQKFYQLDGALFDPSQKQLYTKEGTAGYLAYNKAKAKRLLKESSYDGKPLTIIYSNDNDNYKRIAEIVKQQMEEVGFKVNLVPYEWTTFLAKWKDPKNWDLEVVGWSTRFSPSELGMLVLNSNNSGWYESQKWSSLLTQWGKADTDVQRKAVLKQMNETVYSELPFYKIANESSFDLRSTKLHYDSWLGERFWNTWKTSE